MLDFYCVFRPELRCRTYSSQLEDHNGNVIAFYRPVRPVRYNLGDVYGELHFCRTAGAGIVVSKRIRLLVISPHQIFTDAPSSHGHCDSDSYVVPFCDGIWALNMPNARSLLFFPIDFIGLIARGC